MKVILPANFTDMTRISEHVYVNESMPVKLRKSILSMIPKAKNNVLKVWGEVLSTPTIYACSTRSCFKSLGGGARAHQIFNYIVLSPLALNTELISHEWSHTELLKRTNGISRPSDIPAWFDEGIAVIVSQDIRHNENAWQKVLDRNLAFPQMSELESLNDWNQAIGKYQKNIDTNDIVVVYATAGHVVNQWYKHHSSHGLNSLINGINKGNSFPTLFY